MSLTYAIADLHGRADLLELALTELKTQEPGTIVFLGDYVDRGLESRQIIERLMTGPVDMPGDWVCLTGNHEDMMVQALTMPGLMNGWLGNGGTRTLMSYGHESFFANNGTAVDPSVVPAEHIAWLRQLPLMYRTERHVYVHAGIDATKPLDKQDRDYVLGHIYEDGHAASDRLPAEHVVHGHHQHESGPMQYIGRTNLDTLAWYTGRLVIGVFDDEYRSPVELLLIRGKHWEEIIPL